MKKRLLSLLIALVICLGTAVCCVSAENTALDYSEQTECLLYDLADLLNRSEEVELCKKLEQVSAAYNAQITVVTMNEYDGTNFDAYINRYYYTMQFGYGTKRDGVMLLISMAERDWGIVSNGFAGVAVNSNTIDEISEEVVPYLSDGDYLAAFSKFADECDYYLNGHLNGFPFEFTENLLISLVLGIIFGLTVAFILKGQLKSVRKQSTANVYVRQGSMVVTVQNDLYLYSHTTRRKKESPSSGGGGGSARSSGSGKF
ncbi:MAG: TPM domain-containing protein [Clostridia bacterium]|nr:TPM domain-containing protein [Clostridia bacterium]